MKPETVKNKDLEHWKAIRLLPFAFTAHNFEETWAICNTNQTGYHPFTVSAAQFIIAVSLFTVLGFILVFGKKLYRTSQQYQYTVTGFSGMLFLNVFFPHLLSALYFKAYMPGVVSALILILPITSFILWKTFQSHIFSNKQLAITILFGGLTGVLLIGVFLGIGYVRVGL